jgi:hypothetical protein
MLVWTRKTEGFSNKNMMPRTMNATTAVKIVAVMLVLFIFETTVALSVAGPAAISVSNKPSIEHDNDNDDSKLIEVERAMIELHVAEIDGGKDAFSQKYQSGDDDRTRVSDNTESSLSSWGDDDFIDRHLGEKNAGMDANFLPKNGNTIFESLSPVLSEEECSFDEPIPYPTAN